MTRVAPSALVLLLAAACRGESNSSRPDSARCTDCEIVLRHVGVMSDSTDPGMLGNPQNLVFAERDSAGRILTMSRTLDAVLVFASDGTLLRRLGQRGSGPGEFRWARRALAGPGDSIFVSDLGLSRVTVYAPDLTLARVQSVEYSPSLVLRDGRFVSTEGLDAAARVVRPVRVLDRDGRILKTFSIDTQTYEQRNGPMVRRLIAASANGDLWSVAPGRYTIERWDSRTGERQQSIALASTWFRELPRFSDDERTRPPAHISSMWEDEGGLLWLVFRDADLDWKPPPPGVANVERAIDPDEYERTYDWIIEVVDPSAGAVIASQRFRQQLWSTPSSHVVLSYRESATSGVVAYDVWQPTLVRR